MKAFSSTLQVLANENSLYLHNESHCLQIFFTQLLCVIVTSARSQQLTALNSVGGVFFILSLVTCYHSRPKCLITTAVWTPADGGVGGLPSGLYSFSFPDAFSLIQ